MKYLGPKGDCPFPKLPSGNLLYVQANHLHSRFEFICQVVAKVLIALIQVLGEISD
jgi:hypothetical protein